MDQNDHENNTVLKPSLVVMGTAADCRVGPPIGIVDIGISPDAYLFRVALPGVRHNNCGIKCEIKREGAICIQGMVPDDIWKGSAGVLNVRVQELCPPGPFSISFRLPGPVDPRLFSPTFRADGIMEGTIMKCTLPSARRRSNMGLTDA